MEDSSEPPAQETPMDNGAAPPAPTSAHPVWRTVRRVVVFFFGFVIIIAGVVMLVTPGPAFVVIPAGLAVLATEFLWAKRMLDKVRKEVRSATRNWRPSGSPPPQPQPETGGAVESSGEGRVTSSRR